MMAAATFLAFPSKAIVAVIPGRNLRSELSTEVDPDLRTKKSCF